MAFSLSEALTEPFLKPTVEQMATLSGLPQLTIKLGFLLAPLLGFLAIGFLFKKLILPASRQSAKSSKLLVLYGFISGMSYMGIQSLFFEKIKWVSGQPTLSLVIIVNLIFLTCALASYLIESHQIREPGHTLRWVLFMTICSSMLGYAILDAFSGVGLSSIEFIWVASAFLFVPATCAGAAFGLFFQIVASQSQRLIPIVLIALGTGALLASYETKAIALEIGFSMAFSIMLLGQVALALMTPPDSGSDQSENA